MRGRGQVQKDYSGQFKDERLDLLLEHNPMDCVTWIKMVGITRSNSKWIGDY
jgi:hypothetical protein